MELPQPRPFGTEGMKPTHNFLSLYSPVQQDPRPSQGSYLKTHDFLQPLERVGKNSAKEENTDEKTTLEKPPPPAPPPSVEHLLPGGIGTYSIGHVSYINPRVPKPEGSIFTVAQTSSSDINEENSNCSSYTGSGFTLWEETVVKKGKTRKENIAADRHVVSVDVGVKTGGQWTTLERPSQSSANNHGNSTTFSSLSSSLPSSVQKNQSLIDIIKLAKGSHEEEDDDEEEFVLKNEPYSHYKGNLTVNVDGKNTDQKANTPRSKHSATEQRRRSKINDRFQMLRELIPHSDQKRDKASFLLEVIEYIQFLQEKVHKYEGSYQGWNHDPAKLMAWRNNHRPAEGFVDQSRGISSDSGPALVFAAKFEENNISVSPTIPKNVQNPVEYDMSTATTFKAMDYHPGFTNKVVPLPVPLQPNIFAPGGSSGAVAPLAPRPASDGENALSQPQSQLWQSTSCTTDSTVASDKMIEQELTIESGTISISSVYSQGLLNTLTQALQSSGIDLSHASISVKIDLGKRANSILTAPASIIKDDEVPFNNQAMARSRIASSGKESDQALKRLKTV
ncbi:hypothetical protein F0562_025048 [Nyssa sinensis]|uniref:BHLH domain-containing protein n=1 Tax=Nyssa sinensis TaxID=561372 RepID=A0A5J5BD27_9ASTE|nr:hypothetical protein F0562_025048 [Nyssa sinensis]